MRLLDRWGVTRALARGAAVVPVGEVYRLAGGRAARLAFTRDEEDRLHVGYAVDQQGEWVMVEGDGYCARALGYYQRRLKRIGERATAWPDGDDPEVDRRRSR